MLTRSDVLAGSAAALAAGALLGPRAAGAQTLQPVRIGASPVEPQAQIYYAMDGGFLTKNGIAPQFTTMRNGSVTIETVLAGDVDIGGANVISFGSALSRGLALTAIAPGLIDDARTHVIELVVTPDSPVKTAVDLNGKTVGVTSLASIDVLAFLSYLDKNGGDYKSLKLVEVPQSATTATLQSGRIAAGVLYNPELSTQVAAGTVRVLDGAYASIGQVYLGTLWFTTPAYLVKAKDIVRRTADAIVKGGTWAEANRAASLVIFEKYTKIHEDKTAARYGRTLDPAALQIVFDAGTKYGMFPGPIKASDHCWDGK